MTIQERPVLQLQVLGVSDDGTAIVLAGPPGSGLGPFQVRRDEQLRAAVLGQRPAQTHSAGSALPPREIQARLRAGVAPVDIAAAAGIPVEKVLRYAGPVEAERARVIADARAAPASGSRDDPGAVALAAVVEAQLAGDIVWDSWRREDGTWTVEVRHDSGRARWQWDSVRRRVVPLDDTAHQLGAGASVPSSIADAVEPDEPIAPAAQSGASPARRPSVPSWEDIVFGAERRRASA